MASVLDLVKHYQHTIEKYSHDEQKVLKSIDKLFSLGVTVQHLQETGVGRTVNALRKEPGNVGHAARALVSKWKSMVAAEESDQEGDHNNDTLNYNGHQNGKNSDNSVSQSRNKLNQNEGSNTSSKTQSNEYAHMNGTNSVNKRKYHSSEEEPDIKKSKNYTSNDNDNYKKNRDVKIKEETMDSTSEDDGTENSQSEDSDTDTSGSSDDERHANRKVKIEPVDKHKISSLKHTSHNHLEHKKESSSDDKKRHNTTEKIPKQHSIDSTHSPEKSYSKEISQISHKSKTSSKDKERSTDRKHKSDHKSPEKEKRQRVESSSSSKHNTSSEKHKSSSQKANSGSEKHKSHSDKHSSKSEKSSSSHSQRTDVEKHKRSSEKENSNEKHKSKESSASNSKEKHSSSSKKKSRSSSSSKEKISDNHKSEKKHSSSSDTKSKSSHNKNKHEESGERSTEKKTKHKSSSSSHKSKKSSSSKSSEDVSKKKHQVNSEDSEDGIDCGSGASFAEALGMISPAKPKKKSAQGKEMSSPTTSFTNDLSPAALLAPSAKLAPLPALEISALPEISPNYKPRPPPKLLPHFSDEDAMSAVISTKNQRTKVYSGNKVMGKIPTLYEMCVQILQEHIDALEYTGGVPYDILKPVVDKATPQQLFMLEHFNPYLMDDTDHLWQKFCEKHFRNKQRQEMETWREMYMRCQEEQECKLKSLTANIKIAQEAKKAPIKQTKMAYVDSVVKPPRNIARKQALHGTAHAASASPAARVAALASGPNVLRGGSVRPPPAAPISSSSFNKPKKAPLMQKALQFMRGRKR